jgi:hypothetical protein
MPTLKKPPLRSIASTHGGMPEKEIERLRAALEPFAHSTEIPDSILSGEMGDEAIVAVTFKLGDFRRACALVTNGDRDGR